MQTGRGLVPEHVHRTHINEDRIDTKQSLLPILYVHEASWSGEPADRIVPRLRWPDLFMITQEGINVHNVNRGE